MSDELNLPKSWKLAIVADLGKVVSAGTPKPLAHLASVPAANSILDQRRSK